MAWAEEHIVCTLAFTQLAPYLPVQIVKIIILILPCAVAGLGVIGHLVVKGKHCEIAECIGYAQIEAEW